jgi:hypothetical protein
MQQSVKDYVYPIIESHPLTRNSIRFADQGRNQQLAYRSSIDRRLATLDLSDASDRVHLSLVQRIFRTSGILEYLEDARSLHATLPSGRNIVLNKYASMGSALCFPVEAMVFYTLIQVAMHAQDGVRPSSRSIRRYSKSIDIYGDDIIIPVEYTDVVVRYLESYALKVNISKSFRNSHFRESCGADFYKGIPVNPVYARTIPHDDLRRWGAEDVMSWNATADLFYLRGCWKSAQAIRDLLSRVVRRPIPKSKSLGSGLYHYSLLFTTDLRWNNELHCWKQKRIHYTPTLREDCIDGDVLACLNKWGLSQYRRESRLYGDSATVSRLASRLCTINRSLSSRLSRLQQEDSSVGASDKRSRVHDFLPSVQNVGARTPDILHLVEVDDASCSVGIRPIEGEPEVLDSVEDFALNPLAYLTGRSEGLTFTHSTNRGLFKSKSRWVSLAG